MLDWKEGQMVNSDCNYSILNECAKHAFGGSLMICLMTEQILSLLTNLII